MNEAYDGLERKALARKHAQEMAEAVRAETPDAAFALVGPWGSGKTWLLAQIEAQLNLLLVDRKIVRFSPWLYASEQSLFAGFSSFIDKIVFDSSSSTRERVMKYRRRVRLRKLLKLIGPSVTLGNEFASIAFNFSPPDEAADPPEEIRRLITEAMGQKVVVIIDDVDRLTPDELLTLFKLLRLVSDIPGLNFILSYDDVTIRQLLATTDVASHSLERARDYMEKIVSRRWNVPLLSGAELQALLLNRLPEFSQHADQIEAYEARRYSDSLREIMRHSIATPRAAARYLEVASKADRRLNGEVVDAEMHLALYLQTFAPNLWEIIVANRYALTEGLISLNAWPTSNPKEPLPQALKLEKLMLDSVEGIPNGGDIVDLVVNTFPRLRKGLYPNQSAPDRENGPRMSRPEYIDRYLFGDLNPGDVPDRMVTAAIAELPRPDASKRLLDYFQADGIGTLRKITHHVNARPVVAAAAVRFLAEEVFESSDENLVALFSGRRAAFFEVVFLLSRLSKEKVPEVLGPIYDEAPGNALVRELTVLSTRGLHESRWLREYVTDKKETVVEAVLSELRSSEGELVYGSRERTLLVFLIIIDASIAWETIMHMLNKRTWHPGDVAAVYVSEMNGAGGSNRVALELAKLSELNSSAFEILGALLPANSYPAEWDNEAPVLSDVDFDPLFARQVASWGLRNPELAARNRRSVDPDDQDED